MKVCPIAVLRAASSTSAASWRRRSAVRRSAGSTGSRSRVRASMRDLRCRLSFRRLISSLPTGQGATQARPAGGVFDGPVSQVEIEGSHGGEAFAVVDPRHLDLGRAAIGARTVLGTVRSRCFHASATSDGRWRVSMPGWWRSRSAQNKLPRKLARLSKLV